MPPDTCHNIGMNTSDPYDFDIQVETRFVPYRSRPEDNRFVFAYTVTLCNVGQWAAQLLARRWTITDANGKVEQIKGEGVVGETPWLRPGDDYQYTSGAMLETPVGTMKGDYRMLADDGTEFFTCIAPFTLAIPRTLH